MAANYWHRLHTFCQVIRFYEPEEDIIAACGKDYAPSIMKHLLGLQGSLWSEWITRPFL